MRAKLAVSKTKRGTGDDAEDFVTPADEALVILLIENCQGKWAWEAEQELGGKNLKKWRKDLGSSFPHGFQTQDWIIFFLNLRQIDFFLKDRIRHLCPHF